VLLNVNILLRIVGQYGLDGALNAVLCRAIAP